MPTALKEHRTSPPEAEVLGRALLRTTDRLGLGPRDLAAILGVSPATVSRLTNGGRRLDPTSKEGELALLLVRVFRGLDALVGGQPEQVKAWFHAPNAHVGGVPAERVRTIEGLLHVAQYLDAMRGKL